MKLRSFQQNKNQKLRILRKNIGEQTFKKIYVQTNCITSSFGKSVKKKGVWCSQKTNLGTWRYHRELFIKKLQHHLCTFCNGFFFSLSFFIHIKSSKKHLKILYAGFLLEDSFLNFFRSLTLLQF